MATGDVRAVELAGFVKSYPAGWLGRQAPAVGPLSLSVTAGQVLGLLGPNGSGKSTLLKAMAGLILPSAGSCRIGGHPAGSDASRGLIGYLPESVRLPMHQTGREFLRYCAGLSSLSGRSTVSQMAAALAWAGLGAAVDRRIGTYSKGMRQRLGLAQTLIHEPRILLLDEPASGLDPEGRLALGRLLRELSAQGRTVVFSSHFLAQTERVCDRIAILGRGRLLAEGATDQLLGAAPAAEPALTRLETIYLEKLNA